MGIYYCILLGVIGSTYVYRGLMCTRTDGRTTFVSSFNPYYLIPGIKHNSKKHSYKEEKDKEEEESKELWSVNTHRSRRRRRRRARTTVYKHTHNNK